MSDICWDIYIFIIDYIIEFILNIVLVKWIFKFMYLKILSSSDFLSDGLRE